MKRYTLIPALALAVGAVSLSAMPVASASFGTGIGVSFPTSGSHSSEIVPSYAAFSFDDIAIVPSRRTRAPDDVSLTWQIDAYAFDLPFVAAPMDSVMSPATAIEMGRLGGLGVLNGEGLICNEAPDDDVQAACRKLGADLAAW